MTEPTVEDRETWTYLGRRWERGNLKVVYLWRDADGEEYTYDKAKAGVVGGKYLIRVQRSEDRVSVYPATISFTEELVEDDDERAILIAKDREAYRNQQKTAAEKRFSKSDPLADALQDLERIATKVRSYNELQTLITVVHERLINAWDKRNQ